MSNKKQYGQFFTVHPQVCEIMDSLMHQPLGNVLEPSAGAGNLMLLAKNREHDNLLGFELDSTIKLLDDSLNVEYGDFFTLSRNINKNFNTIIGNPPYVAWKNVTEETKRNAMQTFMKYSEKTNLYHLFLDRCIDLLSPDGQMIMIVPKEWLYTTSAQPLREKFVKHGAFTHIVDVGEAKVFPDASVPALIIFRFQKFGEYYKSGETVSTLFSKWGESEWVEKRLNIVNGYYNFNSRKLDYTVGDFFSVKVGLVSGADKIFDVTNYHNLDNLTKEGNVIDLLTTKGLRKYFFAPPHYSFHDLGENSQQFVSANKEQLINRKIRRFNENNYWHWGAVRNIELMKSERNRFYAYHRTRNSEVFFESDAQFFSGGLIALYAREDVNVNLKKTLEYLNGTEFREACYDLGLTTGNKLSLQPSTLEIIPVIDLTSLS